MKIIISNIVIPLPFVNILHLGFSRFTSYSAVTVQSFTKFLNVSSMVIQADFHPHRPMIGFTFANLVCYLKNDIGQLAIISGNFSAHYHPPSYPIYYLRGFRQQFYVSITPASTSDDIVTPPPDARTGCHHSPPDPRLCVPASTPDDIPARTNSTGSWPGAPGYPLPHPV